MSRAEFSRATKLAAWTRADGRCDECGIKIRPGNGPEYDHRVPDALRKDNSAENCACLCRACHGAKTKQDVKAIAKANRGRKDAARARAPTRNPLPGSRASKFKRLIGGGTVRRDE